MMTRLSIDQQVAICEEHESRWIQCETAEIRRLLVDAERYRWLREHLEYIKFASISEPTLTFDTCDVGLDYAIDCRITGEIL